MTKLTKTFAIAVVLFSISTAAKSEYLYTYTGNGFNEFESAGPGGSLTPTSALTSSNNIFISFTTSTLMGGHDPSVDVEINPNSWTFTDGLTTISSANASPDTGFSSQIFSTTPDGIPTSWWFWTVAQPNSWGGASYMYTYVIQNVGESDGSLYQNNPTWGGPYPVAARIYDLPGVWTITAVPEPDAYAMLATGLGLLGWLTRRKNSLSSCQS